MIRILQQSGILFKINQITLMKNKIRNGTHVIDYNAPKSKN